MAGSSGVAFDIGVLKGLSGLDVMQHNAVSSCPLGASGTASASDISLQAFSAFTAICRR